MKAVLAFLLLSATPVLAQQQPADPATSALIQSLQAQRNQGFDNGAVCEARAAVLASELAKAKEQIKALEDAAAKPK